MNKHTVYFLSPHQQRGMMAEIWANRLHLPDWEIRSAAWDRPIYNGTTLDVMKEIVLDLPEVSLTPYNSEEVRKADLIVIFHDSELEQPEILEDLPSNKMLKWDIRNPELRATDEIERWALYQEICDEIAINIKSLEPYLRFQYM